MKYVCWFRKQPSKSIKQLKFIFEQLEELRDGLKAAEVLLKPGGKLAVITFHSLETRLCKNFLVECSRKNYKESKVNDVKPSFEEVSKAIKASQAELDENSRASSAILRVATRTRNPPIAPTVSYL
jgi:16S rRNA (cytosine1402-N4)-methyltransferase